MTPPSPTSEDLEELLLSCRYGEIDEVKQFVALFGIDRVIAARDENENTVLHMACGNGHQDLVVYLLSILPSSLISVPNKAKSSPLHWAALNKHLDVMKTLIQQPNGPGLRLIEIKNAAGRSPVGEAVMAGWEEGADWLISVMALDDAVPVEEDGVDAVEPESNLNPRLEGLGV